MSQPLPSHARAVIIGGGVIGASVAYHLAKIGWKEVLLLERMQFCSGTTWHAAGLIGTLRADYNQAQLCQYSLGLLNDIEAETGRATGFRQVGSLTVAHSQARFEELKRVAAMNNAFGVTEVEIISPKEARELYPALNTDDLLGASWVPKDGMASPVDVTNAYLQGARQRGVQCVEGVKVVGIGQANGRVDRVITDHGEVQCEYVVNCGGLWARELGKLAGVNVPLHACEHYYAVTEKIDGLSPDTPVLRDHDNCAYFREDAGSLLVGAFEKQAVPWGQDGIPEDFSFDELPGHVEAQLLPVLEAAMQRVPLLQDAGWRTFFCGPESFTPDDHFHLGEAPELGNYFVACGMNSVGIQMSGGVGFALAEWMDKGRPGMDLWHNDIRRMQPFQGTNAYLQARVSETLGLLYENHYPYRQFASARGARRSPVHSELAGMNACFGEVSGWERANWFAPQGVEPKYEYLFGKQNWFAYSAAEHRATRERVAIYDQSSFAKYLVKGVDACACLQKICSANVDVPPGRLVYTHWLNEDGGIEADLTVSRISEEEYWVISGAALAVKDMDWLRRHIPSAARCAVVDITNAWAVLGVMGPESRSLLEPLLRADLSNQAFPFGTHQPIELGYAPGRAARVSYVGELGWELYFPVDQAAHVFRILIEASNGALAGMHALDSCRIEKKFVHFGHDVTCEDNPLEAGLGFVCDMQKAARFVGYDAIARQKDSGDWRKKRLVQLLLQDPEEVLWHQEPVLCEGEIVGWLTSGSYGHTLGAAVGLGYLQHPDGVSPDWLRNGRFEVNVGGRLVPARASLRAMYDSKAERMRA